MRAHEYVGGNSTGATRGRLVVAVQTRSRVRPRNALEIGRHRGPQRWLRITGRGGSTRAVESVELRFKQKTPIFRERIQRHVPARCRVVVGKRRHCALLDCLRMNIGRTQRRERNNLDSAEMSHGLTTP